MGVRLKSIKKSQRRQQPRDGKRGKGSNAAQDGPVTGGKHGNRAQGGDAAKRAARQTQQGIARAIAEGRGQSATVGHLPDLERDEVDRAPEPKLNEKVTRKTMREVRAAVGGCHKGKSCTRQDCKFSHYTDAEASRIYKEKVDREAAAQGVPIKNDDWVEVAKAQAAPKPKNKDWVLDGKVGGPVATRGVELRRHLANITKEDKHLLAWLVHKALNMGLMEERDFTVDVESLLEAMPNAPLELEEKLDEPPTKKEEAWLKSQMRSETKKAVSAGVRSLKSGKPSQPIRPKPKYVFEDEEPKRPHTIAEQIAIVAKAEAKKKAKSEAKEAVKVTAPKAKAQVIAAPVVPSGPPKGPKEGEWPELPRAAKPAAAEVPLGIPVQIDGREFRLLCRDSSSNASVCDEKGFVIAHMAPGGSLVRPQSIDPRAAPPGVMEWITLKKAVLNAGGMAEKPVVQEPKPSAPPPSPKAASQTRNFSVAHGEYTIVPPDDEPSDSDSDTSSGQSEASETKEPAPVKVQPVVKQPENGAQRLAAIAMAYSDEWARRNPGEALEGTAYPIVNLLDRSLADIDTHPSAIKAFTSGSNKYGKLLSFGKSAHRAPCVIVGAPLSTNVVPGDIVVVPAISQAFGQADCEDRWVPMLEQFPLTAYYQVDGRGPQRDVGKIVISAYFLREPEGKHLSKKEREKVDGRLEIALDGPQHELWAWSTRIRGLSCRRGHFPVKVLLDTSALFKVYKIGDFVDAPLLDKVAIRTGATDATNHGVAFGTSPFEMEGGWKDVKTICKRTAWRLGKYVLFTCVTGRTDFVVPMALISELKSMFLTKERSGSTFADIVVAARAVCKKQVWTYTVPRDYMHIYVLYLALLAFYDVEGEMAALANARKRDWKLLSSDVSEAFSAELRRVRK